MMDKELALIFEYASAPQELKDAATAHRKNSKALQNKQAQADTINADLTKLKQDYETSEKAFRVALKAWTPTGA